jgi:hypothetical protein
MVGNVYHVSIFPYMQRFLSQVSNTTNTLNVLLTPHVNSVVVYFDQINQIFTLHIHFEMWHLLVRLF